MFLFRTTQKRGHRFSVLLIISLLFTLPFVLRGQQTPAQLSLADILVGLRSKKVTLAQRNILLTEAVKSRGITFALTSEIEKELVNTGAAAELIEAIREKSPKVIIVSSSTPLNKPEPPPPPTAISTPISTPLPIPISTPTPIPPDASFYRTRANAYILKAEYASAVADYGKAIELNPKDSMTYFLRGDTYEKTGDLENALIDYQKAVEFDKTNEPAKNNLQRLQARQLKTLSNPQFERATSVTKPAVVPQSFEVGELSGYAVELIAPVYPDIAKKASIEGRVTVQVMLGREGNIISAKAVSGHMFLRAACEEAAYKSKFKPVYSNNETVRATGFLSYNFVK